MPDVVVVGGGVAGLVTARDLAAAGLRVTVLEAADRLGGCVAPVEVAGLRLDAGAESFATRTSAVADLLAELGLADAVVTPAVGGAWVQLPDGAVPLPRGGLLGIPASLGSAELRRVVGLRGVLRSSLDRLLPARVGLGRGARRGRGMSGPDDVSLGHVVRVRLGARILERLVAPVVTGVHSVHPDLLDLDAVLPTGPSLRDRLLAHGSLTAAVASLRPSPRSGVTAVAPGSAVASGSAVAPGSAVAGLTGGMNRLVSALESDLTTRGVTLRTRAAVTALDSDADGWTVRCADGTELTAAQLVLALPAPQAHRLFATLPIGAAVGEQDDAGVVLVTLVLDAPALDRAPRGTGVLVADGVPGVRAKALTHATAKWPWLAEAVGAGRHVVRLSYGRPGDPRDQGGATPGPALPFDPDTLRDLALADATRLLGVPLSSAQVVGWARTDWPGGLPRPDPGRRGREAQLQRRLAGQTAPLHLTGAWSAGTGLAAVVQHARTTATAVIEQADRRPSTR